MTKPEEILSKLSRAGARGEQCHVDGYKKGNFVPNLSYITGNRNTWYIASFINSKVIEKLRKRIGIKFVELWAIEIGELGGEVSHHSRNLWSKSVGV